MEARPPVLEKEEKPNTPQIRDDPRSTENENTETTTLKAKRRRMDESGNASRTSDTKPVQQDSVNTRQSKSAPKRALAFSRTGFLKMQEKHKELKESVNILHKTIGTILDKESKKEKEKSAEKLKANAKNCLPVPIISNPLSTSTGNETLPDNSTSIELDFVRLKEEVEKQKNEIAALSGKLNSMQINSVSTVGTAAINDSMGYLRNLVRSRS